MTRLNFKEKNRMTTKMPKKKTFWTLIVIQTKKKRTSQGQNPNSRPTSKTYKIKKTTPKTATVTANMMDQLPIYSIYDLILNNKIQQKLIIYSLF